MTIKEFYELMVAAGAENYILVSCEWGNIGSLDDIDINKEHEYVSI